MQRLQENTLNSTKVGKDGNQKDSFCLYVLFFIRAWQEGGQLYSQTELCCRDTCRQFMLSLTTNWIVSSKIYPFLKSYSLPLDESASKDNSSEQSIGRLVPEGTIWKIFHDVTAGLSHIHSRGIVHRDIKPDNIFFVLNSRLGAVCKVGDFGVAGDIGAVENGEEGDTMYMPQELLTSPENRPSGDIFSLGLSMYELASSGTFKFPREGSRWHEIRSGNHVLELPSCRSKSLRNLVQRMIQPDVSKRPTAERILIENEDLSGAGKEPDKFLTDYIKCVTEYDNKREREAAIAQRNANISRQTPTPPMLNRKHPIDTDRWNVRTPTPGSGTSSHSTISKI
jgi:serine/threonine protein kinase